MEQINTPFEIHTLECMEEQDTLQMDRLTRLRSFEIIWIRKGAGSLRIDMQDHRVDENMIFCLSPGQLRLFRADSSFEGTYISLSPEFLFLTEGHANFSFLDAQYENRNMPVMRPDKEMREQMENIVQMMLKEFDQHGLHRLQVLKGLLQVFIIFLSGKIEIYTQESLHDRDTEMVRKFMGLIRKHFLTKKMVADYARELCVTPNYLNQVVKKISGFTASHHIQQCIVLEAKRKAVYSGLSMKEVADFLGFNDHAHFSKFFKNNSGMNFTSFKNAMS